MQGIIGRGTPETISSAMPTQAETIAFMDELRLRLAGIHPSAETDPSTVDLVIPVLGSLTSHDLRAGQFWTTSPTPET